MKKLDNYSYYLAKGQLRESAIELHHKRYIEVGFFKEGEIDPYENDSIYFCAVSNDNHNVVGVNRLIFKQMENLPTINEFNIYDIEKAKLKSIDRNSYAEMSALTKLPKHDCTLGILRAALQYSLDNGVTYWYCALDKRVYNYMCRMFKFPFEQIGDSKVYLGSETIPCILDLIKTKKVLKEERPALCEYLYEPSKVGAVL